MSTAYYDADYLFKLQCVENGTAEVRAHAATVRVIHSAAHGRAEIASAAQAGLNYWGFLNDGNEASDMHIALNRYRAAADKK